MAHSICRYVSALMPRSVLETVSFPSQLPRSNSGSSMRALASAMRGLAESSDEGVSSRISDMVAPAVIISAAGLLNLAFSNRLASIVGRLRAFDAEQAKLVIEFHEAQRKADAEELQMLLGERIALIHRQLGLIYKRARFARNAVVFTMVSVFFMLFCIAFIGLEAFQRTFGFFAATVFVIGGVFLGTGIAYNLAELSTALNPVEYEVMQLGSGELKGLGAIVDSVVSKLDLAKAIGEREDLEMQAAGDARMRERRRHQLNTWQRLSGRENAPMNGEFPSSANLGSMGRF